MTRGMAIRRLLGTMAIAVCATNASAQVFGTFTWQMQPYCNQVTLTLTSVTGNFTLDGSDNQCGATNKASAVGVGTFNAVGNVTLNFTLVTAPGGRPVHVSAVVSPADGSGTWTDSVGNSGTFAFFGNVAGLPGRPLPTSGLPPLVITTTELASNSVTGAKVADGSLSSADILDGPRAAFADTGSSTALTSTPTIVRTVSLTAPTAGKVIAYASGFFQFFSTTVVENGRCYLSTTGSPGNQLVNAEEPAGVPNSMKHVPFGATKGFNVAAGPVTVNLLCDAFFAPAGNVVLNFPTLTAIFVAQ